ncbi:MAG: chromate efflux transporter [Candidatus Eiseniibacteriota bacterium]
MIPFGTAVRVWLQIGLSSFGGPAGQIAVMHRVLVEERKWVDERRFLHALNYCMLLPGPEAQQLATYIGWLLHGVRGGLVAGTLFVLPGFLAVLALSFAYVLLRGVGTVEAMLFGLKAAVLAVVVDALLRIGRRVVKGRAQLGVAAVAFTGLFAFGIPFPLIVLGAGLLGLVVPRFAQPPGDEADVPLPAGPRPTLARALRVTLVWGALWVAPIALLATVPGTPRVLLDEAVFFSQAAVVTFGGAYAVLAYIAQQAVERWGWLAPGEMMDGLGLAETTPGPLILVLEFVGFVAAYRNPGALPPLVAGTLGAVITTWVTFVPCFLWIFLGAPYVERLRGNRRLSGALSTITAAVVGVILNLAVWFALHVLFAEVVPLEIGPVVRLSVPVWSTVDPAALVISAAAFVALLRFKLGMLPVLGASMLAGVAVTLIR